MPGGDRAGTACGACARLLACCHAGSAAGGSTVGILGWSGAYQPKAAGPHQIRQASVVLLIPAPKPMPDQSHAPGDAAVGRVKLVTFAHAESDLRP
jgi:hypothetical protein